MVFQVYSHKSQATLAAMSLRTHRQNPMQLLSFIQIVLVGLSIATATSVLGTAANIYHTYISQQSSNPWWLPLWGGHFSTASLKASIGTAAGVVLLNVVFLTLTLVAKSKFSGFSKVSIFAAIGVSVSSILLAVSSIVLSNQLDHHLSTGDTIKSWACKWSSTASTQNVSSDLSNNDFESLCRQSDYDFYGNVAVLALQTLLFATAVGQFALGKKTTGDVDSQHRPEKSSFDL